MHDENCIFCKILDGDVPSYRLYEDDDFMVILDAGPASRGHALVIPKEHYRNLYEIPEELAAKAIVLAKKLVAQLTEILGAEGYNLVQNNGEVAGQTVDHFHLHLIPRYSDDEAHVGWKIGSLDIDDANELQELITGKLR